MTTIQVEGHIIDKNGARIDVTGKANCYKGTARANDPTTYKHVGILYHNIGNLYNPSLLNVYCNQQGIYKYKVYRDGNFYPYYGTIEFENMKEIE